MGYKKALVMLSICLISCPAAAGKWSITPSINLTESYTDNLLESQNFPHSSLITELTPGINIFGHGKHLDANFIYQLASIKYQAQSELNTNYDYYNGLLGFKLLNNKWLINLSASKGHRVNNLSDGIDSRENFVTPNQTETSDYIVSTSFTSKVSNAFAYHINLQANKVDGQEQLNNREALSGSLLLNNASKFKNHYWKLAINNSEIISDPENSVNKQDFRNYSAEAGYRVSDSYWLFLQYFDQQNNVRVATSDNLNSSYYGGGLRWSPSDNIDAMLSYNNNLNTKNSNFISFKLMLKPSQRTTFHLSTGKRFYGDYYEFLFNYRLKRFSSHISYNEQVASYSLSLFQKPLQTDLICPITTQFSLNDCSLSTSIDPILAPGQQLIHTEVYFANEQQTYLDKRFNANVSYTNQKINLFFGASHSARTILASPNERHENYANLVMSYRINSRANVECSLSYRDSRLHENQLTQSTAEDQVISLGYDHKLTHSAFGRIVLSRRNREATGSLQNYDENRVSLSLTKEF